MGFSDEQRQAAAATMSSSRDTVVRGSKGVRDQDAIWLNERGRLARAVVADPATVIYLAWLCSNRTRVAVMKAGDLLEEMILGAEGMKFTQTAVDSGAVARLSSATGTLGRIVVADGSAPDAALIERVSAETSQYVEKALLPNVRTGKRLQVKGDEAASKYAKAKARLVEMWPDMMRLLDQCQLTSLVDTELLRAEALRVPTQNLQGAVATEYDPARASAYTLQILAGTAAVEAMSSTVDLTAVDGYDDYITMGEGLDALGLPELPELERTVALLEGATAAETRDLCAYLAVVAAKLDELSVDVQSSLERQGAEYVEPSSSAAAVLLAFAPSLDKSTVRAGKAALDVMRANAFDRAENLLIEGYLNAVLRMSDYQEASYRGRASRAAAQFASNLPKATNSRG